MVSPSPSLEQRVGEAERLMVEFADRNRRYLWTDAFAVCNYLGLARATGGERYHRLAVELVDRVHHELGRFRADDRRSGWISGLSEDEGALHPTAGGLRIGKPLPERSVSQPYDAELEWERDGQYFHYLTRWMHALDQLARAASEPRYHVWARELMSVAHSAFTLAAGKRGLVWKMSTDLSRPLVPSMGHHDPLDGYVTCVELEATARLMASAGGPPLADARRDFATLCQGRDWATPDPLGIGGLLADAHRLEQLAPDSEAEGKLAPELRRAALEGLAWSLDRGELRGSPERRLAFRELGLAIGLQALPADAEHASARRLADELVRFWLAPERRRLASWHEHQDINDVMLATSLVPSGYLKL